MSWTTRLLESSCNSVGRRASTGSSQALTGRLTNEIKYIVIDMLPNCLDQLLGSFWVIWMPKLFETLPLIVELSRTCLTKCCLKSVVQAPAGACIRCHIAPARRRITHFAVAHFALLPISPFWISLSRYIFPYISFIYRKLPLNTSIVFCFFVYRSYT